MRFKDIVKVTKAETKKYVKGRIKGLYQNLEINSSVISGKVTIFLEDEKDELVKNQEYEVELYPTVSKDKEDRFWINWYIDPKTVKEK